MLDGGPERWKPNPTACNLELAATLRGADSGRRAAIREFAPEVTITMPTKPSILGDRLPSAGLRHVLVQHTDTAFQELAASASLSLVVMTPFLNEEGARWALDILSSSKAATKILVIRNRSKIRPEVRPILSEICARSVQVFDYYLPVEVREYETFHAKVVLADDRLAYLGSANFLRYRRHSVEMGVVVKGEAAKTVHFVVSAILGIAQPIAY
ncbi:phospholipase D-like domain-containing protein [Microvirga terrae]|uniref:Phospholipase D n=1 Tax=Microvirga terrae TaxID=2740529 RepID=A0ABY5RRX0_9HYPH|nr:phospholipase D-like domain-containing protein [Microvirga terrae]UVF19991.1 phospholipase D-like domain-containing protein [Microvirga terrae]